MRKIRTGRISGIYNGSPEAGIFLGNMPDDIFIPNRGDTFSDRTLYCQYFPEVRYYFWHYHVCLFRSDDADGHDGDIHGTAPEGITENSINAAYDIYQ